MKKQHAYQEHHEPPGKASRWQYPPVTQAQRDRCTRLIDETTGKIYYRVQSESDPEKTYEVRTMQKYDRWHITCTCPAGEAGFRCKHTRWAKSHAEKYYREREAATTVVDRQEQRGIVD